MLIPILIVVVLIFSFYVFFKDDFGESVVKGVFFGIALSILVLMVVFCTGEVESEYEEYGRIKIASIESRDTLSGSFFLGIGGFESSQYYQTMSDLGNDKYKPQKIYVSTLDYIKETNEIKPCIIELQKTITYNPLLKYIINKVPTRYEYRYIIVVPKNTIIVQYKVN